MTPLELVGSTVELFTLRRNKIMSQFHHATAPGHRLLLRGLIRVLVRVLFGLASPLLNVFFAL